MNTDIAWDHPLLAAKVLRVRRDGCSEIALHVEAMADLRKVVLLEKRLHGLRGVRRVSMDAGARTVRVVWQREDTSLGAMLEVMASMGCHAQPLRHEAIEDQRSPAMHDALKRLLVAGMCAMQVMTYAFVVYVGLVDSIDVSTQVFFQWMGLLLSLPVVFYSAHPFVLGMWQEIRLRRLGLNTPAALSVWLIFLASAWNTWRGRGEVYFDSVTMFVFLVLAARFLELRAMQQGRARTEALHVRAPLLARRKVADGSFEWIPAENLGVGECVWLQHGAAVPADGVLRDGSVVLDVSALSGESQWVTCATGERVLAGSMVISGQGEMRVERAGGQSFAARLADLARRPACDMTSGDADSPWLPRFVAAVLVLTALTLLAWLLVEPARAWSTAVAVLVVACPCAYALTRPSLAVRAQFALARQGVLLTDTRALDRLPRVNLACFDKTGTLTTPVLTRVDANRMDEQELADIAAALAESTSHPLALAVALGVHGERSHRATELRDVPGQGVAGVVGGTRYWLGHAEAFGHDAQGAVLCLGNDQGVLARFEFEERLRGDTQKAIHTLKARGVGCTILSGDRPARVAALAAQLGIDDWQASMSPEQKHAQVTAAQRQGRVVLFVGDGSNDAAALAQADVSASPASGSELAQSAADVLLVSGQLQGLSLAFDVARQFQQRLEQGQRWSLLYNLCGVPLAALGLITPWLAALSMALSSLWIVWRARSVGRAP